MKFRCPYCKHVIGEEPAAICPNCKKGIKVPEHLKESVDKITETRAKEKPSMDARRKLALTPHFLILTSPIIPVMIISMTVLGGILLHMRWKSPEKYPSPKFTNAQTIEERIKKEELDKARFETKALRIAAEVFRRDTGRYPTTEEGLLGLINRPEGLIAWKGPYVTLIKSDPWKNRYSYESTSYDDMKLFSNGPDGAPNTADDVIPPGPTEQERKEWRFE